MILTGLMLMASSLASVSNASYLQHCDFVATVKGRATLATLNATAATGKFEGGVSYVETLSFEIVSATTRWTVKP